MRNICNVDLNNYQCNGSYSSAEKINQLIFNIKPLSTQKSNFKVELSKDSTKNTYNVSCINGFIHFTVDLEKINQTGIYKLRVLSNEDNSDYFIINTMLNLDIKDDVIVCRYRFATNEFELNKIISVNNLEEIKNSIISIQEGMVNIRANTITTDYFNSEKANIYNAIIEKATIEDLNAANAKITKLEGVYAEIEDIKANQVTTTYLNTNFAKIDLTNIKDGSITNAMIGTGVVDTAQIADGSITDAKIVDLTANKINAGILSVERLEIRGTTNSIVYALNDITGSLQAQNVDTLNGEILTPRTITADKIVANAITSNEIAAKTITANNIEANTITSNEIASNTITANEIDVSNLFAQDIKATGTIEGMTLKGGSININDKFIVDTLGNMTAKSGNFTGVVYATDGTFTGIVNATGGTFNDVTANNLTVNTGTFKGDINTNKDVYVGNNIYLGNQNDLNLFKKISLSNYNSIYFEKYNLINGEESGSVVIGAGGKSQSSTLAVRGEDVTIVSRRTSISSVGLGFIVGYPDGCVSIVKPGNNAGLYINESFINNNSIKIGGLLLSDVVTSGNRMSVGYGAYEHGLSLNIYGAPIKLQSANTIQVNTDQAIGLYSNNGIAISNNSAFWGKNTSGTNKQLIGISSSNNLFIGSGDAGNSTGNTNVYAGNTISFQANRLSGAYKAGGIDLFREQSGSYRTVLRPASNGGAYLGTASFCWNTVFYSAALTKSDLKEKAVINDFDFKIRDFIMGLEPIAYRRIGENDTGKRVHIGFGAQTLAQHINNISLGDMSMVQAIIVEGENERPYHGESIDDSKLSWSVNYTETIPYAFLGIQDLYKEVEQLKQDNLNLKSQLEQFINRGIN